MKSYLCMFCELSKAKGGCSACQPKLITVEKAFGAVALTIRPAMNLNGMWHQRPTVRLSLYFISIYWRPPVNWVERSGHGTWTRSYGFFIKPNSRYAHFYWGDKIKRYA